MGQWYGVTECVIRLGRDCKTGGTIIKKIISSILVAVALTAVVLFAGCGNKNFGVGGFSYHWVHIPQNGACFKVESWRDDELGIEVKTEEYGWMFFAEGTYILSANERECPICAALGVKNGR